MKNYFQIVLIVVLLVVNLSVCAQNSETINVVTTAVPFLRISPDPRGTGMGGVGIATQSDVNAVYWNIGMLPFGRSKAGITANYSPWLKNWTNDMYIASVAGYAQIGNSQAIHGAITYFNPGDIQFTDNNGNKLLSYHPREFGISAGYSRKLSERIGIGIGFKYINSNLANEGAGANYKVGNAIASDLGFYYKAQPENDNGWAFGVALTNLGTKISYQKDDPQKGFIPANLGLGASYSKVFNEDNRITIGLDINKLLVPTAPETNDSSALIRYKEKSVVGGWFSSFGDAPGGFKEELREFQFSAGLEYWYKNTIAFRTGYFYENKEKGNRKYFSCGTSIRYNIIAINFSYLVPSGNGINRNPLSNNILLGLNFNL